MDETWPPSKRQSGRSWLYEGKLTLFLTRELRTADIVGMKSETDKYLKPTMYREEIPFEGDSKSVMHAGGSKSVMHAGGSDDPVSESYAVVGWDPIGRINSTIAVFARWRPGDPGMSGQNQGGLVALRLVPWTRPGVVRRNFTPSVAFSVFAHAVVLWSGVSGQRPRPELWWTVAHYYTYYIVRLLHFYKYILPP